MNPAEQRLRDQIDRRAPEPPPEKRPNRFILGIPPGRNQRLHRQTDARGQRQQRVAGEPRPALRDAEDGRSGKRIERVPTQHERAARRAHALNLRLEPELARQLDRRRFRRQHRVGAGFDREARGPVRADQSSASCGCFEHERAQPAPCDLMGRGEAGDAGADDDDVRA
jgi:hypothetical protein